MHEELLSAYLDDELSPEGRTEVEAHLEESPEWRAVLAEVRETRDLVRALQVREAPPGFWDALLEPNIAPPIPIDRPRGVPRVARWLAGTCAAAVVAAVVLVPGQSRVKPPVATMVSTHAARSSLTVDPVSQLAPVGSPVRLDR